MSLPPSLATCSFLCDEEGVIRQVLHDELGLGACVAEGRSFSALADPGSRDAARAFLEALRSRRAAFDWDIKISTEEGARRLRFTGAAAGDGLVVIGAPARGAGGSPRGEWEARICDELSRVNNELATVQRELAKKNAELEKLNELKGQLLGMAAHDLRNPLSVIVAYGQHLAQHPALLAEPALVKAISLINRSSQFMLRLLDDLLDIAQIEAGHLHLERRPTDLAALVEEGVALNAILAEKRGIHLAQAVAAGLPRVTLDAPKIEQVLNNLLSNAIKFSPPDGEIAIRLKQDGDQVVLSVADQGPGIPAGEMKDLFKPFARISVRSATGEKSTGLGLAICRRIVEGHHGRIWAESQEGRGSTFYVALPCAP